jgi:hypothetical protein
VSGIKVWVIPLYRQYSFDIPHVNFYYKIPDSNEIEVQGAKRMIEAIDF